MNHRQDYKIPPRNLSEISTIEEGQNKLGPTNEGNSKLSSFDHAASKRRHKKQLTQHHKQPGAYVTNN